MLAVTFALFHAIPVIDKPANPQAVLTGKSIDRSVWGITFKDGIKRSHVQGRSGLEIFKSVYGNKQTQGELISFDNVLHNHDAWTIIESKQVNIANEPALIVHLRNIQGAPASYIYQYKVANFKSISGTKVKLMQAVQSLFRQSDFSELNAVFIAGEANSPSLEQKLQKSLAQLLAKGD